jgi:uncharacterized membrane protein
MRMNQLRRPARIAFATGFIFVGVLGLVFGDFVSSWPAWVPLRQPLLYAASAFMVVIGAMMLFERTARMSLRILLPYLFIWWLLRLPALITQPLLDGYWFGVAEIASLIAGACLLLADLTPAPTSAFDRFLTSARGRRAARVVFGLTLLAYGVSHFIYLKNTVKFIPTWLPYPVGWAYLTGAGHFAAGLGILFSVVPLLAAFMEASMLTIFTFGVWPAEILVKPTLHSNWTEFAFSWVITAAAWAVTASLAGRAGQAAA